MLQTYFKRYFIIFKLTTYRIYSNCAPFELPPPLPHHRSVRVKYFQSLKKQAGRMDIRKGNMKIFCFSPGFITYVHDMNAL